MPEAAVCQGQVTAGPGGAMTDEVGVITGDPTVRTARLADRRLGVTVQYTGAEEWYTLTGSPVTISDQDLEDFHAAVLTAIVLGGETTVPPIAGLSVS
ncbi:hypothetical protein OG413_43315 [Streptomyces sp. NBC_01433]|uniref:hypothetical protein n=1 Tax=Streptomyces sp. NBC_01433 TaxID=2903864 RepID=UPI00224CE5BD|nr:hypothetical protein [Streptomyces sp. NBC_01433]MCX4682017.1 hypothetical protein [Streptomyces sp. NBC_01433]